MAAERLAAEVEGHFKTQVQEWKNVLLRGSDNALRERHWKGFLSDERAVQDKTTALLALVEDAKGLMGRPEAEESGGQGE